MKGEVPGSIPGLGSRCEAERVKKVSKLLCLRREAKGGAVSRYETGEPGQEPHSIL
jgi:hypothetical protein